MMWSIWRPGPPCARTKSLNLDQLISTPPSLALRTRYTNCQLNTSHCNKFCVPLIHPLSLMYHILKVLQDESEYADESWEWRLVADEDMKFCLIKLIPINSIFKESKTTLERIRSKYFKPFSDLYVNVDQNIGSRSPNRTY